LAQRIYNQGSPFSQAKGMMGNANLAFTDKNKNGVVDVTDITITYDILQVETELRSSFSMKNHYYAFGERACSSHTKWLVGEVKRSYRPGAWRGASSEVKTLCVIIKVILRQAHEGPWLINQADKDNAYQYNGKEINADHGLNWSDFGARWYDACLGRWTSVDPLAELAPDWTPYRYGFNNPLRYTDPTGMNEVEDMKINVTLTQQETNYTFGGYDYNTDDVTLNSTTKTTSRNVTGKFRKADVKVSNKTNGIGYVRSYP